MNSLLDKVKKDRLVVYYQPQVELRTGKVIGAEALVRAIDMDGRIVLPEKFIMDFEAADDISFIDFFVLETICKDLQRWRKYGIFTHISLNFSKRTLEEPDFLERTMEILKWYSISPSYITIEITESIKIREKSEILPRLAELINEGFKIAMDDFGKDYSNLLMLTEINFGEIKLDKDFVEDIENNKRSQVVVKNLVDMCWELGKIRMLAEGIEKREQVKTLMSCNCEYGQGFYYYHPMPLEKFEEMIGKNFDYFYAGNIQ